MGCSVGRLCMRSPPSTSRTTQIPGHSLGTGTVSRAHHGSNIHQSSRRDQIKRHSCLSRLCSASTMLGASAARNTYNSHSTVTSLRWPQNRQAVFTFFSGHFYPLTLAIQALFSISFVVVGGGIS